VAGHDGGRIEHGAKPPGIIIPTKNFSR
jgi:hypothetical protein